MPGAPERVVTAEVAARLIASQFPDLAGLEPSRRWIGLSRRTFSVRKRDTRSRIDIGDPAVDLAIGFSFLPPDSRTALFDAYGGVDETTAAMLEEARRALAWAARDA